MMRKAVAVFLTVLCLCQSNFLIAQNCTPTNINGAIVNINCSTSCTNARFKIPHLRSTDLYTVNSIPYTPFEYVTPGGEEDNSLYSDDMYSNLVNLPFPFCFYDSVYSSIVVGSNGLVTFDAANASCANAYRIETVIPFDGGTYCEQDFIYYPKASIMGAYSDLDPSTDASPSDRKIEWRVEGTAPCRRFVVSYFHIGSYGNSPCSFLTPNNLQIVIYESTGLVEVFFGRKDCVTSTNAGLAILGLQNFERDKATAAPGKNATLWTAIEEGYRFTPNGATSRFVSCELLTLGGAFIANADTSTSEAGFLDVSFNNLCAAPGTSTKYLVRTIFSACVTGASPLVNVDTFTLVSPPADTCIGSSTNPTCAPGSLGTITISSPVGANFQYSIDSGVNYQASPVFNVPVGSYTVFARNTSTGCIVSASFNISSASTLTANATIVDAACGDSETGSITVNASAGNLPYQYAINGGTFGTSNIFDSLLPGSYNITVVDALNCEFNFTARVRAGAGLTATSLVTDALCSTVPNGVITVTVSGGTTPYQYQLDGGILQTSPTFDSLQAGNYIINAIDLNGCQVSLTVPVLAGPGITTTATVTNASCTGSATGTITVATPTGGQAPYSYSINSSVPQLSGVFTGLTGASGYSILVSDALGCEYRFTQIVGNNEGPTATTRVVDATCSGALNGAIIVTPSGGTAPYEYSIDGGVNFASYINDSIPNLLAIAYTVIVKDANNCIFSLRDTVGAGPGIMAIARSVNTLCAGSATGAIVVNSSNGLAPYRLSIDGGLNYNTYLNDSIPALLAGNYTLLVRDANDCTVEIPLTVANGVGVTAIANVQNAACIGSSTGQISVVPQTGTAPFQYSIDAVNFQPGNVFVNLPAQLYSITIRDFAGCITTVPVTVLNNAGATATATTRNAACAGSTTGSITFSSGLGTAPFRFSIDSGANFQLSNTFQNLLAGSYPLAVADSNNCIFRFTSTVSNNIGVTATARTFNSACVGATTGTVEITATNGTSPFRYSIDGGSLFTNINTFRNLAAGNYNLAVRDSNNCSFNFAATIINNPGVIVSTVIDKASCASVPNGKITINPTAGVVPFRYSLDGINFQNSNEFPNLFSGSFTVTTQDSAGCIATTAVVVGNAPRVVIDSVIVVRPTCFGNSNGRVTVYPRLGVPPYKYAINGGTFQNSNVFTGIAATAGDTIKIMDNSGCIKDTVIAITQPTALGLASNAIPATCTGNPDGLVILAASGGTAPYSYSNDPAAAIGVFNSLQPSSSFSLGVGTYVFTVRDTLGCYVSVRDTVLLNDTMRLSLGADTTFCEGIGILLQPQTNAGTTVFNWLPQDGLSDATIKNPLANPGDTTTYYLTAKWGICERRDSITLNILIKPIAEAGNDTAVCFKTPAFLNGSIGKVSGAIGFSWLPANLLNKADTLTPTATPDTNGNYKFYLTVQDSYGCNFTHSDSVLVIVQPLVPAFAGNDTNAVTGNTLPHQLNATGGGAGGRYEWSWLPTDGVNISSPFIANPTVLLQNHIYNFAVKVTDFAGCIGYDTVKITVYDGPLYYLPKAFSPNNDNLNDIFRPIPVGIASTQYFRIFNRLGEQIFETREWMRGWDGNFKGKPQLPGTYVWIIKGTDRKGRVVEQRGTVVLVR
jgi:gliding motility-associated-like protein